jgi:hypothetical protein
VVAAYDSQLKWATALRAALESRGFTCRTVIPVDLRHAVSEHQRSSLSSSVPERLPWDTIVRQSLDADAVVLGLHGPLVTRFSHELFDLVRADPHGRRPPITVSGWVGVIIEKITAGYLARFSTDVVAVNSRSDFRDFERAAHGLGLPIDNLMLSGLPLLSGEVPTFGERQTVPRTLLFADQPTVPETREDRLYVYRRLIHYAWRHPDRRVLLKPRHRPGEDTFHRMQFHPESLLRGIVLPPNFALDHRPISSQLDSIDLLLTVSSTAALEAVGAGVGVAFVADLGVGEQLGNHIFLGSGLLRTFDQIDADELGVPEPDWLQDYFVAEHGIAPADAVAARVAALSERRERGEPTPQELAWASSFFVTQHRIRRERGTAAEESPPGPGPRRRLQLLAEAVLPVALHRRLLRRVRSLRRRPR